jgi:hypothetical protein
LKRKRVSKKVEMSTIPKRSRRIRNLQSPTTLKIASTIKLAANRRREAKGGPLVLTGGPKES